MHMLKELLTVDQIETSTMDWLDSICVDEYTCRFIATTIQAQWPGMTITKTRDGVKVYQGPKLIASVKVSQLIMMGITGVRVGTNLKFNKLPITENGLFKMPDEDQCKQHLIDVYLYQKMNTPIGYSLKCCSWYDLDKLDRMVRTLEHDDTGLTVEFLAEVIRYWLDHNPGIRFTSLKSTVVSGTRETVFAYFTTKREISRTTDEPDYGPDRATRFVRERLVRMVWMYVGRLTPIDMDLIRVDWHPNETYSDLVERAMKQRQFGAHRKQQPEVFEPKDKLTPTNQIRLEIESQPDRYRPEYSKMLFESGQFDHEDIHAIHSIVHPQSAYRNLKFVSRNSPNHDYIYTAHPISGAGSRYLSIHRLLCEYALGISLPDRLRYKRFFKNEIPKLRALLLDDLKLHVTLTSMINSRGKQAPVILVSPDMKVASASGATATIKEVADEVNRYLEEHFPGHTASMVGVEFNINYPRVSMVIYREGSKYKPVKSIPISSVFGLRAPGGKRRTPVRKRPVICPEVPKKDQLVQGPSTKKEALDQQILKILEMQQQLNAKLIELMKHQIKP